MLAGVSTVRDTEAKVKVKALQQVIPEVVSLYHAEVVQWPVSNREFHPNWRKQREESLSLLLYSTDSNSRQCCDCLDCLYMKQVSVPVGEV